MPKVVGIKFAESSMPIFYADNGLGLDVDDFCICPVDDYEVTGFVAGVQCAVGKTEPDGHYREVIRKADEGEIKAWKQLKIREKEAMDICREKAEKHKLNIKISRVRFDDRNNKIIFNFTADKRVDFRELVRDLASTLRSRIELWQIGVRDEARYVDGFGVCGCRLCCAAFIKDFQPVTIRMAKNQDIFLSPNKLSGCCGRLMCCLAYEEKQYVEFADKSVPMGSDVKTESIQGVIIERNLIGQTYVIQDKNENKHTVAHGDIIQVLSSKRDHDNESDDSSSNQNQKPDTPDNA